MTAAGALLCALATRHLLRARHPLIDLRTLRIRTFLVSNAGGALFRAAITTVPFLLPLMFQGAFGWSPAASGLALISVFAGNIAVKPFTTPLLRRFGFRRVLVVNVATAVTFVLCGLIDARTPMAAVVAALFVGGVCRSISLSGYTTIAFADIEPDRTSTANALSSTAQQLATGMVVAFAALALRAADPLDPLVGLRRPAAPYQVAFMLLALLPLAAVAEAVRLAPDAGSSVSGSPPAHPAGPPRRVPDRSAR